MQWGAWGGAGMAVVHNLLPRIVQSGLGVLDPVVGVSALASVLRTTAAEPQLVVSPFDWWKLMAGARGTVFPVFKEFEEFATAPAGSVVLSSQQDLQTFQDKTLPVRIRATSTPCSWSLLPVNSICSSQCGVAC